MYEIEGVKLSKLASCPPQECANGIVVLFNSNIDEFAGGGSAEKLKGTILAQALWRDESYYYDEEMGFGNIIIGETPFIFWINNDELAAESGLPEAGVYGHAAIITLYNCAILYPKHGT